MKKSGYNPFNLSRSNIEYDLATDSWSELEYDFINARTQSLQSINKSDDQQLESILSEIFALPYVIAFASGRVAESFFCPAWPKQKKYVLQNVLFPTCLYHQINNDFFPIEVTNNEFYNRTSNHLFKGNIDCDLLKVQLKEYQDEIAFVWVELANNAAGGCPVSMANIKEVKACIGDIPLVLDATRIIENAYHISEYEEHYLGHDIWDIVKEICSYADVLNASLTKDFGTHTGGFIATRDENLYAKMQDAVSTNGSGLSRTDHYLVCNALNDKGYILSMVKQRMDWVLLLAQKLIDHDITVIQPVGGHCILIDPMSIDGLADLDLPLPSFLSWLYKNTSIRAGIHSVGRQRNTSMNNLIRLAIPLGISRAQIDEISKRLIALFNTDSTIDNLVLKDKPQGLFGEIKANYLSTSQVKLNLSPKEIEQPQNTVEGIDTNSSAQNNDTANSTLKNTTNNEKRLPTAEIEIAGIAVIGMSGRYPDADNLQQFWENLSNGKNSIKMGPDWQSRFIDKNTQQHLGGFIDDVDKFDSLFFSISPREAKSMDPQERLMLEVCWQALEDAGYHPESLCSSMASNNVGVFVGAVWSYYEMLGSENRQLGGGSIANSQHWGISNRVSSFMNFSGPSLTVDTACSSSLTAIHLACESLRNGECKVALAGGINLDLHPSKYHITKAAQFLSDDGQCRAFGRGGSGYVAGEGVGTLVLKPANAAIADGDHIYGVIKSSAINHGGRTAGYTVPSPNAQADLISSAIKKANISAETISYVEAHGTGTELGDPVEIQGTSKAYRNDTDRKQYCAIGSVKTNIGHLEAAAGIAGATKLLLQMQHQQLLPSLHSTELNEYIDFNNSPFYVQQHKEFWQPLELNGQQVPRRAGLSSFGAGGTNVHIIFEEYEQPKHVVSNNQEQLVILSARKDEGLRSQAYNLLTYLKKTASVDINLNDLAHTLQIGRLAMPKRLAIVAENISSLINSLDCFINEKTNSNLYGTEAATKLALDLFDGDESEQIIQVLVNNGSYNKIAKLWANGVDINWKIATKNNNAQKISLPTYPFAKESHWIEASTASVLQTVANNSHLTAAIHPLLDHNCSTFAKQEFSKQFNLQQYIFSDHIVDKLPTLPGVAYMEMARAAAQQASGFKVTTLKNMVWASPINSLGSHDIRISLQHKNGEAHFEICTFEPSGKKNIHSQGKALCTPEATIPVLRKDLNAIKDRCSGFMTKKECYDLLSTRKLTYGDKLQAITGFHYGQKEGLTSLELPSGLAEAFNDYDAHPSILDGAVQSIISLLEYANTLTQPGVPYVPFVLSELNILKPLTHKGFAHLTLDEGKRERDDIKKINIDILDESGQVLVQMKDFSFKAISEEIASSASHTKNSNYKLLTQADVVLYKPLWKPANHVQTNGKIDSLNNSVILFDHNQQNKQALQQVIATNPNPGLVLVILAEPATTFAKIDKQHYQLNPDNTEHIQQLVDAIRADGLTPDNFIHNLSINSYLVEKAAIENNLNNGLLAIFSLSQTLLKNRKAIGSKSLNLTYIYHTEGDNEQPSYSAVNGFMRSIKQEGANINCKTICLNNSVSGQNINIDWAAILVEQNNNDLEISIKDNQRYIKTLESVEVQNTSTDRAVALSKTNGVYLITGGAGGLGIIFAKELAKERAVKLILTGRSSINDDISSKIKELQKIATSVEYISCDLTIANDVKNLVDSITEKHGRLDGLIHAAGIIKDGFLWNKERAQFSQVLAPKMMGTQNLDIATSHIELDYFIMCSSIASTNGNMGQSDYAAGNRFMDDFAQLRQQWCKQGLRKGKTLAINWPLWRSGGMQVNEQAEKWLFDNWGMKPLATNIGLEALHYGLAQPASSIGVVEGDAARICTALSIEQKGHKTIAPAKTAKVEAVTANLNIKQPQLSVIATTPSNNGPIIDKVKTDLTQMVIELLKINESDIDFAENMSTYGFDSVTFTEFANLINNQLEIEVTPLIFFEQETLDELTEYLLEDFAEPLEQHYARDVEQVEQTENIINANYASEKSSEETVREDKVETTLTHNLFEEYVEESLTNDHNHNNNEPIAIIGIDGIMPQSENVDVFWNNLVNEKNLITEIPKDRWDWKKFYGESDLGNSKTEIKWGGFMPEVDKFDAEFFNISPLEAELTDPQQRLFLQSVWHTIEDSGYKASELSGSNTGVFVGIGSSDYHELLREQSSDFEAYSVAGWMHAVLANRISYFFNWSGASEPIGTACSSTLVAVDRAVQAIRSGQCDMCIAGGVSMLLNPGVHVGLGKASMLADDGRCKTFDHKANGYVRSEGVGALLLKPLSKAEADGDNIYAVIKGSAVNHGGHVNTFTTPNPKAQADVLTMAFDDADIDPATLTYIETHGTGTALGDPIEIQGLLKAFKKSAHNKAQMPVINEYCTLGSVKTNAGHLELASGMSGMLKLILSLKNKTIPANINFEKVNPYIKLTDSPFRLADKTSTWQQIKDKNGQLVPRRAGISSFGFGGVNVHVILEEYQNNNTNENINTVTLENDAEQVITISTKHAAGLKTYAQQLINYINKSLSSNSLPAFAVFASGFQQGREAMPKRLSVVAKDFADLINKLTAYDNDKILNGVYDNLAHHGRLEKFDAQMLQQLMAKNDLNVIAENWVIGAAINWQELNPRAHKISLPTYPFQRNRYWILDSSFTGAINSDEVDNTKKLSDSGIQLELLFAQSIAANKNEFKLIFDHSSFYMQEHKITGVNLFPAASYLEIVNYALLTIGESKAAEFHDVNWLQAMTNESMNSGIKLLLEKNSDSYQFSFYSIVEGEHVKYYCQGSVSTLISDISSTVEKFDKNKLTDSSLDRKQTYQLFTKNGFEYGQSLAIINRLNTNSDTVYAELSLPEYFNDTLNDEMFHSSIIDGGLQSILGILLVKAPDDNTQVPVSVAHIKWLRPLTVTSYVEVNEIKNIQSSAESDSSRLFEIKIYDNNGLLSVVFSDLAIKDLVNKRSPVTVVKEVHVSTQTNNTDNLVSANLRVATIDFLAQMIADETRRERATIEADAGFEGFGIDSFLALRMTKKLEKVVGPVVKTVFFEHTTLNSLADYLIAEHAAALGKTFTIAEQPIVEQTVQTGVNSSALRVATIDFLAQMIADET
ncbi:MAG: SDR family NAD(P)-dependent oxidoreductase, partial [Alcanivoracaceae bacterium]|nr:SDR family NAD(P)-dependent oxidoreductase [Alcanivoracaceae bacterium]